LSGGVIERVVADSSPHSVVKDLQSSFTASVTDNPQLYNTSTTSSSVLKHQYFDSLLTETENIFIPVCLWTPGSRLMTGLWKCRLGRSSCLPVPASSVSDERGSTAHLRPASLRPHLRHTRQPPLAPGSGECMVQDGRAHVQGHSWNCAGIPESTGSCHRSAWSTFPPLCSDQSSAGAIR